MPRTPLRVALAAACLTCLAAPAAAGAADLQVGPAAAHTTIKSAVTAARATPEADTITIAPGLYVESVNLLDAADAGLTIVGAGDGTDPAASTIIRAGINQASVFAAWQPVTLRGVRLEHPGLATDTGLRGGGALVYGDGSRVEDVTIDMETEEQQDHGLDLRGKDMLLRDVRVDASGGLAAYAQDAARLRIEDTELRGDGGGFEDRSSDDAAGVTLTRVRVATAAGEEAAVRAQTRLTVDSSLITGGGTGIDLRNADVDGTELVVRGSTLDPGVRGTDTEPTPWGDPVTAISLGFGQGLVDSSIVFDALDSWDDGAGELRCEYSAVAGTVRARQADESGAVSCPDAAQGNLAVGTALFGTEYELAAASAARDAGRPGALDPAASATDLAGRPRIAVPAGCAGRTDMGAFETPAAACPPVQPGGAEPGTPTAPATTADRTAPRVAGLKLRGGRLRGTLSEAATARVTVKRCKGNRCVRTARLTRALPAGRFAIALPRKARGRAGRYAVSVAVTDAAGNAAKAALTFRIKR